MASVNLLQTLLASTGHKQQALCKFMLSFKQDF